MRRCPGWRPTRTRSSWRALPGWWWRSPQKSTPRPDGSLRKNYYVNESVGIACGLFITALHEMGLATLTHTPNPMIFLTELFGRPATERPYILFPVGYPADDCEVPDLSRKSLSEALVVVRT